MKLSDGQKEFLCRNGMRQLVEDIELQQGEHYGDGWYDGFLEALELLSREDAFDQAEVLKMSEDAETKRHERISRANSK